MFDEIIPNLNRFKSINPLSKKNSQIEREFELPTTVQPWGPFAANSMVAPLMSNSLENYDFEWP